MRFRLSRTGWADEGFWSLHWP